MEMIYPQVVSLISRLSFSERAVRGRYNFQTWSEGKGQKHTWSSPVLKFHLAPRMPVQSLYRTLETSQPERWAEQLDVTQRQ